MTDVITDQSDISISPPAKAPAKRKPRSKNLGGKRQGAGRPVGARGVKVVKREKRVQREVAQALEEMVPENADVMNALEALEHVLKIYIKAGNLSGIVSVAREILPYRMSKHGSLPADVTAPLPADLLPDPESRGDEPGPRDLILDEATGQLVPPPGTVWDRDRGMFVLVEDPDAT